MSAILDFVAAHQLGIGLIGTLVVVLAVIAAAGRRHETAMGDRDRQSEDRAHRS